MKVNIRNRLIRGKDTNMRAGDHQVIGAFSMTSNWRSPQVVSVSMMKSGSARQANDFAR